MQNTKITKIASMGALVWLITHIVKYLLFPLKSFGILGPSLFGQWLYGAIFTFTYPVVVIVFLIIYFKKAVGQHVQDGIRIGLIWFVVNELLNILVNTGRYVQISQVLWNMLATFVLSVSIGFLFKYGYISTQANNKKKNEEPRPKTDSRRFDSGFFKYIPTFGGWFYHFAGPSPRRRFFRVGIFVISSLVVTILFVPVFFVSSVVGYEIFGYPEFDCYLMVCSPEGLRGWLIMLLLYTIFYYIVFRVYKFLRSFYKGIKKLPKID